jgi:hypothetical protein
MLVIDYRKGVLSAWMKSAPFVQFGAKRTSVDTSKVFASRNGEQRCSDSVAGRVTRLWFYRVYCLFSSLVQGLPSASSDSKGNISNPTTALNPYHPPNVGSAEGG